jgi:3-oxoacyl-(acyl-carrier-protein) synthase
MSASVASTGRSFSVMRNLIIAAASLVTETDLSSARLGPRHSRMDLASKLALLAVESVASKFDTVPRDRIAICLAARAGSLSTDVEYWKGRALVGGPSPTLFAYTLPSAAIGEIAIRHKLTGPNLCFVGGDADLLAESRDIIDRGEAEGCVCVCCNIVTAEAAALIQCLPVTTACAIFITASGEGHLLRPFDRDMESLCATVSARNWPT